MSYVLHQCDCGSVIKVDVILYEMLPDHALADYLNDLCWKRCDGDFAPVFGIYDTEADISSEDYISIRFAEGVHGERSEYDGEGGSVSVGDSVTEDEVDDEEGGMSEEDVTYEEE